MPAKKIGLVALVALAGIALQGWAQGVAGEYAVAAPLSEYMMAKDAEVALARSAAPASISGGAEVLVLGRDGYASVVKSGIFLSSGILRFAGRSA
jgi:hypothetical protein